MALNVIATRRLVTTLGREYLIIRGLDTLHRRKLGHFEYIA